MNLVQSPGFGLILSLSLDLKIDFVLSNAILFIIEFEIYRLSISFGLICKFTLDLDFTGLSSQ